MAYTGRAPSAAPLTSADINDGAVAPADLSTGAPSWTAGGAVTLPYNGSNKLATTSTGIDVTGTVTADRLDIDYGTANSAAATIDHTDTADGNGVLITAGGSNVGKYVLYARDGSGNNKLYVDANGDISFYEDTGTTAKFFWDASAESLGIGITPETTLHINRDVSTTYSESNTLTATEVLKIANRDTTAGTAATILFNARGGGGGNGLATISAIATGTGSNALGFGTRNAGGNVTERMRIDSSGRVTMPYQPAFDAYANSGGNEHFSGGSVPTFNTTILNTGNHFNGSRFTAPAAGKYQFSYSILGGSAGGYGLIELIQNGGSFVGAQNWTQIYMRDTNGASATSTQILNLSAGDYVELYIHPTHNRFYWNGYYSKFSGHLIG